MQLVLTDETPPSDFERLLYVQEPASGLQAFICIHSTACGPAAGGCRMWRYETLDDARKDVLRLARGMTCKNAIANLGLGGGKSVIIRGPQTQASDALFRAFGQAVNSLNGQYYTAEDVGISPKEMAIVAEETPYAVGLEGGTYGSGDPSPFTAEGVFQCLKVGAEEIWGRADLVGRRVMVQGLGHVGMSLAQKLSDAGASLLVSDINETSLKHAQQTLDAEICPVGSEFDVDMDIFAPCALGGVLTEQTATKLKAKLVCGAANNQLASPGVAQILRERSISYLPDYVVNAGGIISVASEIHKRGPAYRESRMNGVSERIRDILKISGSTGKSTTAVADEMVEVIIAQSN